MGNDERKMTEEEIRRVAEEILRTMDVENMSNWSDEKIKKEESNCSHGRRYYFSGIRSLDLDIKLKRMLCNFLDCTVKIGNKILHIGKMILNKIFMIYQTFPNTINGLLIYAFLSLLLTKVPLIGAALGAIVQPLLMILTVGKGFMMDCAENVKNKSEKN